MHRTHKLISAAAAALIVGGLTVPALARRQSAFSGIAQQPSQATCFSNAGGVITNSGCSTRTFCVPLVYDWSAFGNWANVTVTAFAPAGSLMSCQTVTVGKQGQFGSWSGNVNAPMNGSWQDIVVNGGGIPDGGAAYSCCDIPFGGSISVLNY
jgi:hypothetical protein